MPAVLHSWRFRNARSRLASTRPWPIKQAVVGTAPRTNAVAYMVRTLTQLDHDPHPDHAADALACAICHVNLSRTRALTGGEFYQQRGTGY